MQYMIDQMIIRCERLQQRKKWWYRSWQSTSSQQGTWSKRPHRGPNSTRRRRLCSWAKLARKLSKQGRQRGCKNDHLGIIPTLNSSHALIQHPRRAIIAANLNYGEHSSELSCECCEEGHCQVKATAAEY